MKGTDSWRICVIFAPQPARENVTTVVNTLRLLEPLASSIYTITGNFPEEAVGSDKVRVINVAIGLSSRPPLLVRAPRFLLLQLKMGCRLCRLARKIDVVFLGAGASTLVLPALVAKLTGKKLVSLYPGPEALQKTVEIGDGQEPGPGSRLVPTLARCLERISHRLSNRIVTFRSATSPPGRQAVKTVTGGSRFYTDVDVFKVEKAPAAREDVVGYIGRFEEIKGVINLVRAIPGILREVPGARFLLCGDGSQRPQIERLIAEYDLGDRVTLTGWLPHEELPRHLNEMKLLVIPSHTEVGPQIVFEAMACGTPAVATAVGVIPDVVRYGETGFILEDNSPECIARNVVRALKHPGLSKIALKARQLIEEEYTYQKAVDRYRQILESL